LSNAHGRVLVLEDVVEESVRKKNMGKHFRGRRGTRLSSFLSTNFLSQVFNLKFSLKFSLLWAGENGVEWDLFKMPFLPLFVQLR
jgi:hypothetical protein